METTTRSELHFWRGVAVILAILWLLRSCTPAFAQGLIAVPLDCQTVQLTWPADPDEEASFLGAYRVDRSQGGALTDLRFYRWALEPGMTDAAHGAADDLQEGTTYRYRVRPYCKLFKGCPGFELTADVTTPLCDPPPTTTTTTSTTTTTLSCSELLATCQNLLDLLTP